MDSGRGPVEQPTLFLDIYGEQRLTVAQSARGGGPNNSPYIVVRSPHVLTYALDSTAVVAYTYAWFLARAKAAHIFLPRDAKVPNTSLSADLVGSVTLRGRQQVAVNALTADRSPTGHGHLTVRIGGLAIRVHDRAALQSHFSAWVDAHAAAHMTFTPGPRRDLDGLARHAEAEAGSRYPTLTRVDNREGRIMPPTRPLTTCGGR